MHHALPSLAALATLLTQSSAQQAGSLTAENHPAMPWEQCTASGCTQQSGSIVLDSNWRWVHSTEGSTNCYTGQTWNEELCPSPEECAANCALDGADYQGVYGITASGGSLSLKLVTGSNVGSRTYLMDGEGYKMFELKNKEFTFDVDVSKLPCGVNGALYFVEMDEDGGLSRFEGNTAGAEYGTGYCDAQCPQDIKFINGLANVDGWTPSDGDENSGTGSRGSCCNEMDVWEANSISSAFTPHVCSKDGQTACTSDTECGAGDARYDGVCDKDGCDFNSYRMGNTSFYGSAASNTVDTTKPFTVVTKFVTADGTDTGPLSSIERVYVQGGKEIQNSKTDIAGIDTTNKITDGFCKQQKTAFGDTDSFESRGGLEAMGASFERGMVLVMSIWVDYAAKMRWLDAPYPEDADKSKPGIVRGTCAADSGVPADVISGSPGAAVTFSNIKFGALGSTY